MDIKCVLKYPKLLTLETLINSNSEYKDISAERTQRKISDLYNLFEFILLDFLNIYCPMFIFFTKPTHFLPIKNKKHLVQKSYTNKLSAKTINKNS